MNGDLGYSARRRNAFLGAAEIERAAQAEAAQDLDIGIGDVAEMVGAKDPPPAYRAAGSAGIAAEVTEIAGAGEIEVTGRGF
jgi:hypothetical protein